MMSTDGHQLILTVNKLLTIIFVKILVFFYKEISNDQVKTKIASKKKKKKQVSQIVNVV